MVKILIIRFSSFGDVTQSLSLPARFKELATEAEIHWVTRQDFAALVGTHPDVKKVWPLDRKSGLKGLFKLSGELRKENFSHVYDAHNNLRSHLISFFLRLRFSPPFFIRKSQKRFKRFMLFRLKKNLYEMPFSGQRDLLEPLTKWHLSKELPPAPQLFLPQKTTSKMTEILAQKGFTNYIALAPSAAHELKRWPLENWKRLLSLAGPQKFVILGGAADQFLKELEQPGRVLNMAGQTDFLESAAVVKLSSLLISNDTGVLHLAEQLGHSSIALMGPAVFGFPSRKSTLILQRDLPCRPCSKHGQGPCVNKEFQKCLRDISVQEVFDHMTRMTGAH